MHENTGGHVPDFDAAVLGSLGERLCQDRSYDMARLFNAPGDEQFAVR